jgi:hypothetical protein
MYTIYVLIDPRDKTPRYVGITDCPPWRLREHLRNLEGGREKRAWIRELQQSGLAPSMEELETVPTQAMARQRERWWTRHYLQLGIPLTNVMNAFERNRAMALTPKADAGDPRQEWITMAAAARMFDVSARVISYMAADGRIRTRGNPRDHRVRLVSVSELRARLLPPSAGEGRTLPPAHPMGGQGAQLVTMSEAARVFGVTASTIGHIAASKGIRTYENRRDRRVRLVSLSELESYFAQAPHGPR